MFMKTKEGRLQNLRLLQTVRAVKNDDDTYSVGWVQMNGVIVKEEKFDDLASAQAEVDSIIDEIVGG